jgi:splicing factor 1
LYIPVKEFPEYNFIGLVIGPRGNTQKRLEKETGCKISVRGKGSLKDGSKGRGAEQPDADDELHVHITGDDEDKVIIAEKLVLELLQPIEDEKNEHKQKQLRELALINGTLKEDEFCPVCGERGHRQFECPHRGKTFKAAGVVCAICGDQSHPTRDCPFKKVPFNTLLTNILPRLTDIRSKTG